MSSKSGPITPLTEPIKIVVAENYAISREGLCTLLRSKPGLQVVGHASNGQELLDLCAKLSPDIAIMQGKMMDMKNEQAASMIVNDCKHTKVIGLAPQLDRLSILEMIRGGVSGILLKSCSFNELLEAIDVVSFGGVHISPTIASVVLMDQPYSSNSEPAPDWSLLTKRETEILTMMASAKNTKEIASELDLSTNTVYVHRRNIMEKLNIKNSVELTKIAIREGITDIY